MDPILGPRLMRPDFVPGKWAPFFGNFSARAVLFSDAAQRLKTVCVLVVCMWLVKAMYNAIDRVLLEMGSLVMGAVEKNVQVNDKDTHANTPNARHGNETTTVVITSHQSNHNSIACLHRRNRQQHKNNSSLLAQMHTQQSPNPADLGTPQ